LILNSFNKKYNLNIKDINVNKIDLRWKKLGNEGLVDLCKIKFNDLKELILNNNNISDIKPLEKVKFENLEILDLSQNKISDISILKNVSFKGLKQLYLGYNNISDIKVFGKNIFQNLETLSLSDNKIDQNKDASLISNLKSKIDNCDI
jgi:Leucine-rich repeat (LRR) protein